MYGSAHTRKSCQTCTVATRLSMHFERSKHTSYPSLQASIPPSPKTDGIFSSCKKKSQSTSYDSHCCTQTSPPGSTSMDHTTLMSHPWAHQNAESSHMKRDLHANPGTSVAIRASTLDQHRTTIDASRSSRHLRQQSLYRIPPSSNTQPWQYLH